jgi:hypothetical protein
LTPREAAANVEKEFTSEGMHVDIETDNVDAEVARLEKLGASKREQVRDWWVMTAPDGQPFCVVPVQSKNWPAGSVEWES